MTNDPRALVADGPAMAGPTSVLWDKLGTPTQPHRDCPTCKDASEVGSHDDRAWCCRCGWHGSLTEMHASFINPRTGKPDEPDVVTGGLDEESDDERPTPSRVE